MRVEAISMCCQDINHSAESSVTDISRQKVAPSIDGVKSDDLENRFAFGDF